MKLHRGFCIDYCWCSCRNPRPEELGHPDRAHKTRFLFQEMATKIAEEFEFEHVRLESGSCSSMADSRHWILYHRFLSRLSPPLPTFYPHFPWFLTPLPREPCGCHHSLSTIAAPHAFDLIGLVISSFCPCVWAHAV
ncbi:hypothetical protein OPV22_007945 [Ensete ventricosum]|uniref:Uncharacterized protein n=1 Tax=Ensete ventricosum TaxID=4639 RepID=A0AAV8R1U1_ENSVE|nr:hypothetical protein OPV22_007945 [Ensete ventricosum]